MLAGAAPAAAQPKAFYGVAPGGTIGAQDFQLMQQGRVGGLRVLVNCSEGCPSFATVDALIGGAAARGIRSMPIILQRPPPSNQAQRQALANFAAALARQYGPGGEYWRLRYPSNLRPLPVVSWQILNEQNSPNHFGARPRPKAYAQIVRMMAQAIRGVHRRAEIVLGGMFASPRGPGNMTSRKYLNRFYKVKRIKRFFNTVAIHPYAPRVKGTRKHIQQTRKVMRRNKHRKGGLRITEYGAGSATMPRHRLNKGPRGQARLLTQSFRMFKKNRKRWKLRGVHWFAWRDRDPGQVADAGCPFCASSGLVTVNRERKPSYFAFRRAAG